MSTTTICNKQQQQRAACHKSSALLITKNRHQPAPRSIIHRRTINSNNTTTNIISRVDKTNSSVFYCMHDTAVALTPGFLSFGNAKTGGVWRSKKRGQQPRPHLRPPPTVATTVSPTTTTYYCYEYYCIHIGASNYNNTAVVVLLNDATFTAYGIPQSTYYLVPVRMYLPRIAYWVSNTAYC